MSANDKHSAEHDPKTFGKQFLGGYSPADVDAFVEQAVKELNSVRLELSSVRAERDRLAAELAEERSKCNDLSDKLKSDSHLIQILTDRVDELNKAAAQFQENQQSVEGILKIAHAAAEQLKADAQKECDEMVRSAERRADRILDEMRERMASLQSEFEKAKREYAEFLSSVRATAQAFVRQVDEKELP